MIEFILFIIFSTLEFTALIYFSFVLYRLSLRYYTYHLIFISLFLSYLSYTLRFAGIEFATSFITITILFLFIWLMFRIQVFYAFVVTMTGYLIYALVQGLFILLMTWIGWIDFEQAQQNAVLRSTMQFGTAALVMGISRIIANVNWGFDIVPHSEFTKVKLKYEKRMLLIVNLFSFLLFGLTYLVFMYYKISSSIYMLLFINLLAIMLILYFVRKNDKKEDKRKEDMYNKGWKNLDD